MRVKNHQIVLTIRVDMARGAISQPAQQENMAAAYHLVIDLQNWVISQSSLRAYLELPNTPVGTGSVSSFMDILRYF